MVKYLSVSDVPEEVIPSDEVHRLRFCPPSARDYLSGSQGTYIDPFRVIRPVGVTLKDLQLEFECGRHVELQWKMRNGGPFGWWHGEVQSVEAREEGSFFVNILFKHFPESSPWYRLTVPLNVAAPVPCVIGGYSGGVRRCTIDEERLWRKFFPERPISF